MVKAEKTTVKDASWIAEQCKLLSKEITDLTEAKLQGFVMDSAAANRAAFSLLEEDIGPLVNLQCASHTLSLLLKDFDKRMPWVHDTFEFALMVSNFFQSSTKCQGMMDEYMISQGCKPKAVPSHCDTRFGSKYIVLAAVADVWLYIIGMISSPRFVEFSLSCKSAADFKTACQIEYSTDARFHNMHAIKLCEPIFKAMAQCEADKPLLSRMLPMVNRLTEHVSAFSVKYPSYSTTNGKDGETVTLLELVNKRLREFYYKPSLPAAFLLDPLNFEEPRPGQIGLRLPH
jgi:hypothetical protein